jgi:DNA-binding NtrC family response regulator
MMDDRTALSLSALEFGSGPAVDDTWLHGGSEALGRLRRRAEATADAGCRVIVITGPIGVGKRRLARWIHRRIAGPLAPLIELRANDLPADVSTAPGTLLLTGADRLSGPAAQTLKQRIAQLPGARLIMTSSRPLTALRESSLEHEQLFGRMTEAILDVPALSERKSDIAGLARAALERACARYDLPTRALSPGALTELERQDWPGNARQIASLLEQAALRATGRWIGPADLGLSSETAQAAGVLHVRLPGASLREIEIKAITLALELADGRIVRAAELLGITRHALRRKLDKFGPAVRTPGQPDPDASI